MNIEEVATFAMGIFLAMVVFFTAETLSSVDKLANEVFDKQIVHEENTIKEIKTDTLTINKN